MTKLQTVRSYVRRSRIDPYEAIRKATTEQLRFEVAMESMARALDEECDRDPDFMRKMGFA